MAENRTFLLCVDRHNTTVGGGGHGMLGFCCEKRPGKAPRKSQRRVRSLPPVHFSPTEGKVSLQAKPATSQGNRRSTWQDNPQPKKPNKRRWKSNWPTRRTPTTRSCSTR